MPVRAMVVCRGCRTSTSNVSGYCDECVESGVPPQQQKKQTNPFYGTARWKKFRNWYAKRQPLCEDCLDQGKVVPMNMVDHITEIKDGGALLSAENARSLCNKCHSLKTKKAKREREGQVESPPTPPALPFGSENLPLAKLGRGGIEKGGCCE